MNTIALEAQKASLAREILCTDDETIIGDMWSLFKQKNSAVNQQKKNKRRPLGILDGKAKIVFKDGFEMTTEELLALQ